MRKLVYVIFWLFITLNVYSQKKVGYQENDLLKTAQNGLSYYLELIKQDDISNYGFKNPDELNSIELGKPYRIYTLSEQFYSSEDTILSDCIISKNEWLFPLMINDSIKAFLTVGVLNDELQVVGLGANILANSINDCEKQNKKKSD